MAALLCASCGTEGQPLGVTVGGEPVDLEMVGSTYEAATVTLNLFDEGEPDVADDETTYHLRVRFFEPGSLEGDTVDVAGMAVWEDGSCLAPEAAFIADETSSPSVLSVLGWTSGGLLCGTPDAPLSQRVDGSIEVFEVEEGYLSGFVDVTVEPLLPGSATAADPRAARFHGRFDTR